MRNGTDGASLSCPVPEIPSCLMRVVREEVLQRAQVPRLQHRAQPDVQPGDRADGATKPLEAVGIRQGVLGAGAAQAAAEGRALAVQRAAQAC